MVNPNRLPHLDQRALAAYYRSASRQLSNLWGSGSIMEPGAVETVEVDGLSYIRLSNVRGILAVYRIRTVNGESVLKGLKRWPKALEAERGDMKTSISQHALDAKARRAAKRIGLYAIKSRRNDPLGNLGGFQVFDDSGLPVFGFNYSADAQEVIDYCADEVA